MVAESDPPQLTAQAADQPSTVRIGKLRRTRRRCFIVDHPVLRGDGIAQRGDLRLVIASSIGSCMPDAGAPAVLRDIRRQPLDVLEIAG